MSVQSGERIWMGHTWGHSELWPSKSIQFNLDPWLIKGVLQTGTFLVTTASSVFKRLERPHPALLGEVKHRPRSFHPLLDTNYILAPELKQIPSATFQNLVEIRTWQEHRLFGNKSCSWNVPASEQFTPHTLPKEVRDTELIPTWFDSQKGRRYHFEIWNKRGV